MLYANMSTLTAQTYPQKSVACSSTEEACLCMLCWRSQERWVKVIFTHLSIGHLFVHGQQRKRIDRTLDHFLLAFSLFPSLAFLWQLQVSVPTVYFLFQNVPYILSPSIYNELWVWQERIWVGFAAIQSLDYPGNNRNVSAADAGDTYTKKCLCPETENKPPKQLCVLLFSRVGKGKPFPGSHRVIIYVDNEKCWEAMSHRK